jgi:hypothetical protein
MLFKARWHFILWCSGSGNRTVMIDGNNIPTSEIHFQAWDARTVCCNISTTSYFPVDNTVFKALLGAYVLKTAATG